MASIQEIRQQYPQYNDLSDQALADAMYKTHYSDMPREQFNQKIGLSTKPNYLDESPTPDVTGKNPGGAIGRGLEQTAIGFQQAGGQLRKAVGLNDFPEYQDTLAKRQAELKKQSENNGLGSDVTQFAASTLANPLTYAGGGILPKAAPTGMMGVLGRGAMVGASQGAKQAAMAPTDNPNQKLGDRVINTAMGTGIGALTGLGTAGAGIAAQKYGPKVMGAASNALQKAAPGLSSDLKNIADKIGPKPVETAASKALKYFGFDFSKAKTDPEIAAEIRRAVSQTHDNVGATIADRTEGPQSKVSTLSKIGQGVVGLFKERKGKESEAWNTAEPVANGIKRDLSEPIEQLKTMAKELQEQVKAGTATEKSKADLNLINGAIRNMGGVIESGDPQTVSTLIKEIGGKTRTVTRTNPEAKPFAADAEKEETFTPEATVSRRDGKIAGSVESEPINRTTSVADRVKTTEQSPYTVTTKRIKPGKEVFDARPGSVGDLVRGMKYVNSEAGAAASSGTRNNVRKIINDQLADVSKENPQFQKLHKKAIDWTQRNADIYRDESKMADYGLNEEKLWNIHNKLKNGRMLAMGDLEDLNNMSKNINSSEDLLEFRRLLPRDQYNTLMRSRWATLTNEINMDARAFKNFKPLLAEMMKQAQWPENKIASYLDNYETVAKKMTNAGIPGDVEFDSDVGQTTANIKAIAKTLGMAAMYTNPVKKMVGNMVLDSIPKPTSDMVQLRNFKNLATPKLGYSLRQGLTQITGAAIGSAIGQNQ